MAEERTYIIPLRREFIKAPSYKKTKKAVTAIKSFLIKHMKGDEVKFGSHLNEELWARGNKHPPPRIKVKAIKDEKNMIRVELPEFEFQIPKEDKSKSKEEKTKPEVQKDKEKADLSLQKNIKKAAKEQIKKATESKTQKEEPNKEAESSKK